MSLRLLIMILLFAGGVDALNAAASSPRARGNAAMAAGDYQAAVTALEQALAETPEDADLCVLLGIARYHAGDPAGASTVLQRGLAAGAQRRARGLYYLGISASAAGERARAQTAFVELLREHPDSTEAARLTDAIGPQPPAIAPQAQAPASHWAGQALLLGAYDDNPQLHPDDLASLERDDDLYLLLWAQAAFRWHDDRSRARMSGTNQSYAEADELDYSALSLSYDHRFTPHDELTIRPGLELDTLWLDGAHYAHGIRAEAQFTWNRADWSVTTTPALAYRAHAAAYDRLDGTTWSLETRIARAFTSGWLRELAGECALSDRSAATDHEGRRRWRLGLQAGWRLGTRVGLTTRVLWSHTAYDQAQDGLPLREEEAIELQLTAYGSLTDRSYLLARVSWTDVDADIAYYAYSQSVISFGLGWNL
ncbi:MAG: tetratricopeptide repeat protein [Planctomycetota bacterium]